MEEHFGSYGAVSCKPATDVTSLLNSLAQLLLGEKNPHKNSYVRPFGVIGLYNLDQINWPHLLHQARRENTGRKVMTRETSETVSTGTAGLMGPSLCCPPLRCHPHLVSWGRIINMIPCQIIMNILCICLALFAGT